MNNSVLLSIITINLNNKAGLEKTIQSVISQTNVEFEYLIIDGGSVDGSVDVINKHSDSLTCWISELDDGIYHAMNKGINRAKGTYCLFLNSGDWLVESNVIERYYAQDFTADLVIGGCHVTNHNSLIHTYVPPINELTLLSFYKATIPHQSTFIKKDLFEKFGFYNEAYAIHGDYDFWMRVIIINQCTLIRFNQVVANYNLEGLSNNVKFLEKSKMEIQQILHYYFPERVLADYHNWELKKEELHFWEWIKAQKVIYKFLRLLYNLAVRVVCLKKAVIRLGSK